MYSLCQRFDLVHVGGGRLADVRELSHGVVQTHEQLGVQPALVGLEGGGEHTDT